MNWKHRALYQLMSDISEEHWCAGWMSDNEYALWQQVADPKADRHYGIQDGEDSNLSDLRSISAEIHGWIRWVDRDEAEAKQLECGPCFVPMAEWLRIYDARQAKQQAYRDAAAIEKSATAARP